MNKLFITFTLTLFCSFLYSQNDKMVNTYANFLLEIEKSISVKGMTKAWKKRKSDWENGITAIKNGDVLNEMSSEFKNNILENSDLPDLKWNGDYNQYGSYLIKFSSTLSKEISDINVEDFISRIEAEGLKIEEQITAELIKELKISLEYEFATMFKNVLNDSKSGSFANIITNKIGDRKFGVNTKLTNSVITEINVDEEEIFTYKSKVKLSNDLASSKGLLSFMQDVVKKELAGYKEDAWTEDEYVNRTNYQYEFEAEKFSITAKKPTVAIGMIQKSNIYYIVWSVTEPVFKDWSKSNRDWNK